MIAIHLYFWNYIAHFVKLANFNTTFHLITSLNQFLKFLEDKLNKALNAKICIASE